MGRPRIVTLIGSTRFYDEFQEANFRESLAGHIVLAPGFMPGDVHGEHIGITPEEKMRLDAVYLEKVAMADEVLVIQPGGYIGESTRRELDYAIAQGKTIRYWTNEEVERAATLPPAVRAGTQGGDRAR